LVNNRGGTYVPTELIFARTWVRGFNVKLKLSPHLVVLQSKPKNHCKETHVLYRNSFSPRSARMSPAQLPVASCQLLVAGCSLALERAFPLLSTDN
jgi:hypothetical protein